MLGLLNYRALEVGVLSRIPYTYRLTVFTYSLGASYLT